MLDGLKSIDYPRILRSKTTLVVGLLALSLSAAACASAEEIARELATIQASAITPETAKTEAPVTQPIATATVTPKPEATQIPQLERTPINPATLLTTERTYKFGDVINHGYFMPMIEIQNQDGTSAILPSDEAIRARLVYLHNEFPPIQIGIWSQKTGDVVEATSGREPDQSRALLQLWFPSRATVKNPVEGEWSTILGQDSIEVPGAAGTGWTYGYETNPDGTYKDGWTEGDVLADVLAGIARRARDTKIAPVSTKLSSDAIVSGLITVQDGIDRGWIIRRDTTTSQLDQDQQPVRPPHQWPDTRLPQRVQGANLRDRSYEVSVNTRPTRGHGLA